MPPPLPLVDLDGEVQPWNLLPNGSVGLIQIATTVSASLSGLEGPARVLELEGDRPADLPG